MPAPSHNLDDFLSSLFVDGRLRIGQIEVRADHTLRHIEDRDAGDLETFRTAAAAREIARYDEHGKFRPLKTAPTLKRGWLMVLESCAEVRLALEFFYPSELGLLLAARQERLSITPLRETLGRQTGMYRVTQKTTDDQAERVIRETCNSESGCLRRVLWAIDQTGTRVFAGEKVTLDAPSDEAPLICREACNLLVAACRKRVKEEEASG